MCNDLPKNIFLSKLSTTFSRTGVKSIKDKHGATALLEVFDSMTLCHRFSWVRLSYKRKWKSVKFRIIHRCHNQLPHAGVGTSLFYFVKSPVSSHLPSILWQLFRALKYYGSQVFRLRYTMSNLVSPQLIFFELFSIEQYVSQGFHQVWYQGGVKATVSGAVEDLKFKISEVSDQFWSQPSEVLNLRSSNTQKTVDFTPP